MTGSVRVSYAHHKGLRRHQPHRTDRQARASRVPAGVEQVDEEESRVEQGAEQHGEQVEGLADRDEERQRLDAFDLVPVAVEDRQDAQRLRDVPAETQP